MREEAHPGVGPVVWVSVSHPPRRHPRRPQRRVLAPTVQITSFQSHLPGHVLVSGCLVLGSGD